MTNPTHNNSEIGSAGFLAAMSIIATLTAVLSIAMGAAV